MNDFELDDGVGQRLQDGMELGGSIELPFVCPPVWVINGNAQMRALAKEAPALYFGGWAAEFERLVEAQGVYGLNDLPSSFAQTEMSTKDGKSLNVAVSRVAYVAPIGMRKSWIGKDGARFTEYTTGCRQHVQFLALIGSRVDKAIEKYCPVVLTAKGYQAANLVKAFQAWASFIEPVRRTHAPNAPAWCFYAPIGTFGDTRTVKSVGAEGLQSPITPIVAWMPNTEKPSVETLKSCFVGKEEASWMADLKDQAQEWLGAWKNRQAQNGHHAAAQPTDFEPEQPPDNFESEIPF